MHRWTARLLLLVVLVPGLMPIALAHSAAAPGAHCQRQPVKPVMQCHHGMAAVSDQGTQASFSALEQCCENHECCKRSLVRRQGPQAASQLFVEGPSSGQSLSATVRMAEPAFEFLARDSARAPPRV